MMAILSSSCTKEGPSPAKDTTTEPERVLVTFDIATDDTAAPDTKVAPYTDLLDYEKEISEILLYVYKTNSWYTAATSQLEAVLTTDDFNISTVSGVPRAVAKHPIELTAGYKSFVVLINPPALSFNESVNYPYTRQWIWSAWYQVTNVYSKGSPFFMYGELKTQLTNATGQTITVPTKRKCARITLSSITNNLEAGYSISNVYCVLCNARRHFDLYDVNIDSGSAYVDNPKGYGTGLSQSTDPATLTSGTYIPAAINGAYIYSTHIDDVIANGATYSTKQIMYSGAVSPTYADAYPPYLVVAARINGAQYYYNIPMPNYEENSAYTVALTINKLGADIPCVEHETGTVTASITMGTWSDGGATDVDFDYTH